MSSVPIFTNLEKKEKTALPSSKRYTKTIERNTHIPIHTYTHMYIYTHIITHMRGAIRES